MDAERAQSTLGNSIWNQLGFPKREYGIVLNDGQELILRQTLTVHDKVHPRLLPGWQKENDYISINFSTRQTSAFEQKFELKLKKSTIPPKNYSRVRNLILEFKSKINGGQ